MIGKNNPLNVRSSAAHWRGQTGQTKGFCDFSTLEYGVRVVFYLLTISYPIFHGLYSYKEMISRYAPPSENKTQDYINYVCAKLKVRPDDMVFTENTDVTLPKMVYYMAKFEGNPIDLELCYDVYNKWFKNTGVI